MEPLGRVVEVVLSKVSSPRQNAKLNLGAKVVKRHLPNKAREPALIPPGLLKVIKSCSEGESPWPLFLFGSTGTGKTCAALVMLDWAGGEYFEATRMSEDHNDTKFGRYEERLPSGGVWTPTAKGWRLARLEMPALLVVDELGIRERASQAQYEIVKYVLDLREGRPLVCISNMTGPELEQVYDARIVSRLGAGTIFDCSGGDRRLE